MIITVFGTGSPTKEEYQQAYKLGKKIAKAGHILKNGGYAGIMEASAKGCLENNGKTIGICIKGHHIAFAKKPNDYLSEVIIKDTMNERVKELLNTDALIVMAGKIGTLEELFIAWIDFYEKNKGKIYLVGEKNKKLIDFLLKEKFLDKRYSPFIEYVDTIDDLEFLKPQ